MLELKTHFTRENVSCPCGCGLFILNRDLLLRLEAARLKSGIPFIISSWCRCHAYGESSVWFDQYYHLKGMAVDIKYANSEQAYEITRGLMYADFPIIHLYQDHIHTSFSEHPDNKCLDWDNL
jgi:hypothetical protein